MPIPRDPQSLITLPEQLLDHIGTPIITITGDGAVISANASAAHALGWMAAELPSQAFRAPLDASVCPQVASILHEVQDSGTYEGDVAFIRHDGSPWTSHVVATREQTGSVETARIILVLTDPPPQPEAAATSSDSSMAFRLLFAALPHPMWVYDTTSLRFLEVNDAAIAQYGYSRDEFRQLTIADIRPTGEKSRLLDHVARHPWLEDDAGTWRHVRKDGSEVNVRIRAHSLEFEGRHARLVIAEDATSQVAAETSQALLAAIVESSDAAIVARDSDGRITAWNHAAELLYGYTAATVLGQSGAILNSASADANPNTTVEALDACALAGETRRLETRRRRSDGTEFDAALSVFPIMSRDGHVLGVAAITRDITGQKRAEREQAALAAIVNSSDDAFILRDLDGRVLTWSPGAERLTGYTAEEMLGSDRRPFDPPGAEGSAQAGFDRIRAGETVHADIVRLRKDGSLLTVAFEGFPVRLPCGDVIGYASVSRDISDRIRAEAALRESETNYRAIFEGTSDALYVMDLGDDGNWYCTQINRAYTTLLGRTPESVLNKTLQEGIGDPAPDAILAHYARAASTGKPVQWEHTTLADDRQQTLSIQLTPARSADGVVRRLYGSMRDVTSLREAQADLQAVFESADSSIVLIDAGQRVLRFNRQASAGMQTLTGHPLTIGMALGQHLSPLFHDEMTKAVSDALAGTLVTRQVKVTLPSGAPAWFEITFAPVQSEDGSPRGVAIHSHDITEQKRANEALEQAQKLESLAVLAGGVAHDFNNLLVGILGNAGLAMAELPPGSPVRETITEIEVAGQRAADLARQMLAYSGKGRFVIQPVALGHLVQEMTQLLRVSIARGIVIQYDLAPGLPPVEGDATQLRQVIMNLVVNASDAIGSADGVIRIHTGLVHATSEDLARTYLAPQLPGGDYVSMEVTDTGSGMNRATLARLFDPFFTTKFTGRGLGLAAVLGIVRGHRGAIHVASEPGVGTTFRLLFPVAVTPTTTTAEPPVTAPAWRGEGAILVVDDEPTVRAVTARALRTFGFETLVAADGEQGVGVFERESARIRAVLLDLTMPRMNGEAAFTAIRALQPAARVILMSGYSEQDAMSHFAGRGIAGFLQKPYSVTELREILQRVMADS